MAFIWRTEVRRFLLNVLTRELYSESSLDAALARLETVQHMPESIDEALTRIGINNRDTLQRTAQKGMEEYVDGLVDLRHAWKPKMMDGSPEEKREIYQGLANTMRRMDEFSEPYVSAVRLITDVALRQLAKIADKSAVTEGSKSIEEAVNYGGASYDFHERNMEFIATGGKISATEGKKPASVGEAYAQIARGFMHLKDLLNLIEAATTPEVYDNVTNTNEFPEVRIGKCFEAAHEIDQTMRGLVQNYEFLSKKSELPRTDKRNVHETLKLLKKLDRSWITRSTQWYAALQFHEKPWDIAYKASIAATVAGAVGTAYSLRPFMEGVPHYSLMFLTSSLWAIISGVSIYAFTDAGPKTAKYLRKLDERIIKYRWL